MNSLLQTRAVSPLATDLGTSFHLGEEFEGFGLLRQRLVLPPLVAKSQGDRLLTVTGFDLGVIEAEGEVDGWVVVECFLAACEKVEFFPWNYAEDGPFTGPLI